MKSWSMTKPLLVVGIAVVLVFAGNVEVQASGTVVRVKQALNTLGAKALNKTATWGMITLLSLPLTGNVLAQNSGVLQSTQQAVQTQSPAVTEQGTTISIPLYDAVQRLDYLELKELLEAGVVDVNARDKDGKTAFHYPYANDLFSSNNQKLKLVLAHGADPRIEDTDGASPYYDYDYLGGGEPETAIVFVYFAKALYGINGKDKKGHTALDYALLWANYNGDLELARQLVAEGADVRIPDYEGIFGISSPLEAAALLVTDRDAFVSLLFEQEKGIVTVLQQQGERLYGMASEWDNKVVANVLSDYGHFDESYTIPLYDVVKNLKYSQLKVLLEAGVVDVNARDKDGNTVFHHPYVRNWFSSDYQQQELSLILAHGADPRIRNNAGDSPYYDYDYLMDGEPETAIIFAFFVERLFGINGKTEDGATALGYAMAWADYSGELDLARQLVAEGADVRLPEYHGSAGINSPIEAAAVLVTDRDAFVSLLFKQEEGIVNVLKQKGKQLIELAEKWDNQVVVDVLHTYGVKQ